jgi:hypothetical protein
VSLYVPIELYSRTTSGDSIFGILRYHLKSLGNRRMKIKIPYTWANTRSITFKQDVVRREGKPFRAMKLASFISKKTEIELVEIKNWLVANEITDYLFFGVFDDTYTRVYYCGLQFVFKTEDHALYFKLRFS